MSTSKSTASMAAPLLPAPRDKAMADASAGVIASLLSLWFFYPFEIWKLEVQTNGGRRPQPEHGDMILDLRATAVPLPSSDPPSRSLPKSLIRLVSRCVSQCRLLFAGLGSKSLHTASSSFCYFYLYSWILSAYHLRRRRVRVTTGDPFIAPSTRLILSAVAASLNTLVTLPMDVISTRHQLGCNDVDVSLNRTTSYDSGTEAYIFYDASSDEGDDSLNDPRFFSMETTGDDIDEDENDTRDDEIGAEGINTDQSNLLLVGVESPAVANTWTRVVHALALCRTYPWLSLWKGLVPSLLLCSNPAIHFTAYDVAKAHYLQRRHSSSRRVNLMESFLLGLFAKFVATMATYPLIQAKVRLMTLPLSCHQSVWSCLWQEYTNHGVTGLYRGCNLQLLHTMLKSALMMMLRERIEQATRQWVIQKRG